jgi:hypothetical protein
MTAAQWIWFVVIGLSALFATSLWATIFGEILRERRRTLAVAQRRAATSERRLKSPAPHAHVTPGQQEKRIGTGWAVSAPRIAAQSRNPVRDKSPSRQEARSTTVSGGRRLRRTLDRGRFGKGSPDRPVNV